MGSFNTCRSRAIVVSTSCPASSAKDGRLLWNRSSVPERQAPVVSLSRAVLAVVLLCFAGSGSANAHTGGTTGFAAVTVEGQTVRYSLSLGVEAVEGVRRPTLSTDTLHRAFDDDALANIVARHVTVTADGRPCAPVPGVVQSPAPGRSTVSLVVQYACAAPVRALVLTDDLFVAL